jgi:hypothetical protein
VVADPEVDPPMNRRLLAVLLVLVLLPAATVGLSFTAGGARAATAAASRLTGNVTGPTVLAIGANARYPIHAIGGPAIAPNGTQVGNLTYYASVTAGNLSGVTITPPTAAILNGTPGNPLLEAGNTAQTLTILVEVSSVLNSTNESINLTYTVQVVQPYVLSTEIVNNNDAIVSAFPLIIYLDGVQVGNVTVPAIQPHGDYNLTWDYATLGLSQGYHTFTISLLSEHGLVQFVGGTSSFSETVYVPGPPPDYTLWYLTGGIAFLGVLLIFGARLGARRRTPSKK